jgi:hypothetical protein
MEVVGVAVAEVVVPDLVNVGSVSGFCDVNFAHIDELLEVVFVIFSPGPYKGGSIHGQAARLILCSGKGVGWLLPAAHASVDMMRSNQQCVPITNKFS